MAAGLQEEWVAWCEKRDAQTDANIIPFKFVFTDKTDETNKLIAKKARMVARGYLQGKFEGEEKQQTTTQQESMIACVVREGGVKGSVQQRLCLVGARYQTKAATHRWSDDQDFYGQDCCQRGDATRVSPAKMLLISMLCDNGGAVATAGNDMMTTRIKHVDTADLYIKQAVQEKFILREEDPTDQGKLGRFDDQTLT